MNKKTFKALVAVSLFSICTIATEVAMASNGGGKEPSRNQNETRSAGGFCDYFPILCSMSVNSNGGGKEPGGGK